MGGREGRRKGGRGGRGEEWEGGREWRERTHDLFHMTNATPTSTTEQRCRGLLHLPSIIVEVSSSCPLSLLTSDGR